ncbi:MAG TPA: M48 family metallopeptidase [Phycisphaerae bacterium]|nr:M48 family metallopeptidase [Phycisphaerae bacterium]
MHLHLIICFALLIWWPEERLCPAAFTSPAWTWLVVFAQVPAFFLAAVWTSTTALRRLDGTGGGPQRAQHFYHRSTSILRMLAVAAFVASLFFTRWSEVVRSVNLLAAVPGLAGLIILLPFFGASVMIFLGTYPIDRSLHQITLESRPGEARPGVRVWSRGQYLSFNLRHHLLVVAVPMALILAAFDWSRSHEASLIRLFRLQWAPEVAPAVAAAVIFVFAPAMLRYIWPTKPLADGPLRRELESICRRIGFRYRDILVWQSGGMMVNAAVMGLFAPVRYVMLSDGLLDTMSSRQIEAVFGHEVGHIRHHHIPFFLLFAVCSMLVLSAVIEALRLGVERGFFELSVVTIQAIGFVCILAVWGIGFGWISRRFERQADLFGTRCVTSTSPEGCKLPCSAHGHSPAYQPPATAVCATATAVFASALDRVAVLNGIPPDERSWRHGSIADRIRFLTALSGDPGCARRFRRLVRRIKAAVLLLAVGGSVIAAVYLWDHPVYGFGVGVERAAAGSAGRYQAPSPAGDSRDVRTDH